MMSESGQSDGKRDVDAAVVVHRPAAAMACIGSGSKMETPASTMR